MADSLHRHSELSASDGTPTSVQVDTNGDLKLGVSTARNSYIYSDDGVYINIDANNDTGGQAFVIGSNRKTNTGGTQMFRMFESGATDMLGPLAIGTTSTATVALDVNADSIRIRTSQSPTGSGTGIQGEIAWDGSALYVCIATNSWKRVLLSSF